MGRPAAGSAIFVDASAWVAYLNRRERHHASARAVIDACVADETQIATTYWTIYEAMSLVKTRMGWQSAADLWTLVSNGQAVTLVTVTAAIEAEARDLFLRFRDKTWGVVDCASLIAMETIGCRVVLAFGEHFAEASRQRGFVQLPER